MSGVGPPVFGITLGDAAGVGPELVAALWRDRVSLDLPVFCAIGPATTLTSVPVQTVEDVADAPAVFGRALPCLDVAMDAPAVPGQPGRHTALAALAALERSAVLANSGAIAAVVTAPVAKNQLYAIGFKFPGQTEFYADASGCADYAMMLAGPELRTVPLTIHVPLADVAALITTDRVVHTAEIILAALRRDFGLAMPRLAICGLNPHAGENGALGLQDAHAISPAVAHLRARGETILGVLPADTAFAPHWRPRFDAALCMYHDQALIPVKTLDFDRTVNITIGLPIIRTSPDHGTGFDIAGQGIARPASMIEALRQAAAMVASRRQLA